MIDPASPALRGRSTTRLDLVGHVVEVTYSKKNEL